MAKTVQLSEEAYRTLFALKDPGESFSDAVLRLARRGKDPLALLDLGKYRSDWDYQGVRAKMDAADRARRRPATNE